MTNVIVLSGLPLSQSKAAFALKTAYDLGAIEVDLDTSTVYSVNTNTGYYRKLKIGYGTAGYAHVSICIPVFGTYHKVGLHRVIAYARWGDDSLVNGIDVDHIDGDIKNNHISNLQLLTHGDNVKKGKFDKKYPLLDFAIRYKIAS